MTFLILFFNVMRRHSSFTTENVFVSEAVKLQLSSR